MYINCFLVLMILSQNIPQPTKAKPYFTKIHRLNSEGDFDDIVDWTAYQNFDNQEQEQKTYSPNIRQRSITSEATYASSSISRQKISESTSPSIKDEAAAATETIEMPSPPSNVDIKGSSRTSDAEKLEDGVADNEDHIEFGEGLSNMYKNMKNKFHKKKKCKNCFSELEDDESIKLDSLDDGYRDKVKYILPYRRSAPFCLLNDGRARPYLQPAAVPVVQPVLLNSPQPVYIQDFPIENQAAIYEVQWADPSSISSSTLRKRREIDIDLQKQGISREKVNEVQRELASMTRALNDDFLRKNNLSFLPIVFAPHCNGNQISAEMQDASDLGQLNLKKMDTCNMKLEEEWPKPCVCFKSIPKGAAINEVQKINTTGIRHLTIILFANNSLNLIVPGLIQDGENNQKFFTRQVPSQTFQSPFRSQQNYIPYSRKIIPYKRNVIDNLKQYLQDAFNFIDIRRVLTEDEIHGRRSREIFDSFQKEVIPGILIYPNKYGTAIPKYSRETAFPERAVNPFGFCSFSNCANRFSKFKRSLDMRADNRGERDAVAEDDRIDIEKKQADLEKEIEKDLKMDKEVVEALNEGSSNIAAASLDNLKKDEEYLEKENLEMLRNEEVLESPDTTDSGIETTEQTCIFTEPLITEEVEPLTSATDSMVENMAAQAEATAEAGGKLDDVIEPEPEELEADEEVLTQEPLECAECQPEELPCPTPPHLAHAELVHGAKSKKSETIGEFEDEMGGYIDTSKTNMAHSDRHKTVVEASTRNPTRKIQRTHKSRQDRCGRFYRRSRRNVKSTDGSCGSQETTQFHELELRNVPTEVTEFVKVTSKVTTSPFAMSEEVEDVSQVLFTSESEQEQLESTECDEEKGGESTKRTTIQKNGEAGVSKCSTVTISTSEIPAGISNYVQSEVRDENDETVTETLTRLLRDLTLVNRLQNFLKDAEENEYEVEGEFGRRNKRESAGRFDGFSTGRKLFSMEVHQMAKESKGPFQKFRKRTSRRRSGKNFRFSRGADRWHEIRPEVDTNEEEDSELYDDSDRRRRRSENKRWKDYVGDYVEWIPNFRPFLETNYQNYQF